MNKKEKKEIKNLEDLLNKIKFSELWQEDTSSLMALVPIISLVLNFIILIIVLVKK